jgi:HAD superfamily hydrolase (TIGR01490 family)
MNHNLAIFDVDKTMFPGYSIIDFAGYLKNKNKFIADEWQVFLSVIDKYKKGNLGYNDFATLVVESYARGIAGQQSNEIETLSLDFWKTRMKTMYGYLIPLLKTLKSLDTEVVVVSGSTEESMLPMLRELKIDKYYCTEIGIENGIFLSKVKHNIASHEGKLQIVKIIFEKANEYEKVYGFGDYVADLSFLELVDIPVVIGEHDKELVEVAKREGWRVVTDPNIETISL